MATDTPAPETPVTHEQLSDFGHQIADGIAAGIASTAPKKVSFGAYAKREAIGRSKLKRECYQNGFRMEGRVLSNKEINLLNQIHRSGRYIDRKVEVVVKKEGANDEIVYISYKNKTVDDRFEFRGYVRSLEDMLQQIVQAQAEEDETEGLTKPEPKRSFGVSKATRAAFEAAEAP